MKYDSGMVVCLVKVSVSRFPLQKIIFDRCDSEYPLKIDQLKLQ